MSVDEHNRLRNVGILSIETFVKDWVGGADLYSYGNVTQIEKSYESEFFSLTFVSGSPKPQSKLNRGLSRCDRHRRSQLVRCNMVGLKCVDAYHWPRSLTLMHEVELFACRGYAVCQHTNSTVGARHTSSRLSLSIRTFRGASKNIPAASHLKEFIQYF